MTFFIFFIMISSPLFILFLIESVRHLDDVYVVKAGKHRATPGSRLKALTKGLLFLSTKNVNAYDICIITKPRKSVSGKIVGRTRGFRSGWNPKSKYNDITDMLDFSHGESDRLAFSWLSGQEKYALFSYPYVNRERPWEKHNSKLIAEVYPEQNFKLEIDFDKYCSYITVNENKTDQSTVLIFHKYNRLWWIGLRQFLYIGGLETVDFDMEFEIKKLKKH